MIPLSSWELCGWQPEWWRVHKNEEKNFLNYMDVPPLPARVPASVQGILSRNGFLPEGFAEGDPRSAEWVENRHWIFQRRVRVPADGVYRLVCPGLDGEGEVYAGDALAGRFANSHAVHAFDLSLTAGEHLLRIVFLCPPRWAGQSGFTSRTPVIKPRFNYTWDWCPRMVQIGITAAPYLLAPADRTFEIEDLTTSLSEDMASGVIRLKGRAANAEALEIRLLDDATGAETAVWRRGASEVAAGVRFTVGSIRLWHPAGEGGAACYRLSIRAAGEEAELVSRLVGFRRVEWLHNPGAPESAAPWLCRVNGREVFLQGVNWTPVSPLTADASDEDYRRLIRLYRDMGVNILRIWGGASRERELLYDLCARSGIMVWQEFPMSSSSSDNLPPSDAASCAAMLETVNCYVSLLASCPALILWSGGNELMRDELHPCRIPDHVILAMIRGVLAERDPERRMVATSASGPVEWFLTANKGRYAHEDTHGPWRVYGSMAEWREFWLANDSLICSETGCCAASSEELLKKYYPGADMRVTADSVFWNRPMGFWNELEEFRSEHGRDPSDPSEYIRWTRERQYDALGFAAWSCKRRFPACGGVLIWMGHDCWPCTVNTSVIDFDRSRKPGYESLRLIFSRSPEYWREHEAPVCSGEKES